MTSNKMKVKCVSFCDLLISRNQSTDIQKLLLSDSITITQRLPIIYDDYVLYKMTLRRLLERLIGV